jgi:hypothetical protein
MKSMAIRLAGALALGAALLAPAPAAAQCVDGTITAEFQSSGKYTGLWKYCLEFSWKTKQGLSNLTIDFGYLKECGTAVCGDHWYFETPAGTSDGTDGCTVEYVGEFNCQGNPSIGLVGPVLKWDAIATDDCEAEGEGTGKVCFYTPFGPQGGGDLATVLIKNGQNVCEGTIKGARPSACATDARRSTWGRIKSTYR